MTDRNDKSRVGTTLSILLMAGALAFGLMLFGADEATAQPFNKCAGSGPNQIPNGILEPGEDCDDGNMVNEDGCTNYCGSGNCVDDLTGTLNNCTANDVNLALVINDKEVACELGQSVKLSLTGLLQATSSERYDIGTFIATDGGTAYQGQCFHDYLPDSPNPLTSGGFCSNNPGLACTEASDCSLAGTCDDGATLCNQRSECPPVAGTATCLISGGSCTTDSDCFGFGDPCVGVCNGGATCDGGYDPLDGLTPFLTLEDPEDLCGDIEQAIDTYRTFAMEVTVPCQDTDNDGRIDIGSCVSWSNQQNESGACVDIEGAIPRNDSKCRCETVNIGNVYVAGEIIVEKVCDPTTASGNFLFDANFDFESPAGTETPSGSGNYQITLDCGEQNDSVALPPTEISGSTYSVAETVPTGFELTDVTCTSSLGNSVTDPTAIDLESGETVTCVFTNVEAAIELSKICDPLSKVGDTVDYTVTLDNDTGSAASALVCTIDDTLLGTLASEETVVSGGSIVKNPSRTVQSGDPDPLVNNVSATCYFAGDPSKTTVASDSASCSTDLFQPAFSVTKTGDTLSKVGDDVDYTFTLSNTSSANTPALTCTATDDLLGPIWGPAVLPPGDTVVNKTYTVQAGATGSITNTVTLSCALPAGSGFTNTLSDVQDSHTVTLFTPAIGVTKDGDTLSKVGDDVDYTFTLSNNSSANTPALTCTATDDVLGDVWGPAVLPSGDTVVNKTYNVPAGATGSITNTVTLSCDLPPGFTNTIADVQDSHTVTLFTPSIAVTKDGDDLSKVGDDVDYTFTLSNNSSANTPALTCTATDDVLGDVWGPAVLPPGDTVANQTYNVPAGATGSITNTVTLSCALPSGFTNTIADVQDSHTVTLFTPSIAVTKDGDDLSKVGDDVDYTFTLSNNSSANTPALTCTATDDVLGDVWGPAVLPSGDTVVNQTYSVPAGATGSITNTVTLSCALPSGSGFTNTIADVQDSHTVTLFTPAIGVTKDGDTLSKVGDDVDYTFTLSNNSSANTPALTCTATDDVLGDVWGPAVLPPGDTVVNQTYNVPAGATGSITNTVTLSCALPSGFTNTIADVQDSHTVTLFTPSIAVTKDGDDLSKVGDDVDYTFTLSNNSSANTPALTCTATDDVLGDVWGPAVLPSGDTVVNQTYSVPAGATGSITNTVTLSCALPSGFTNTIADVQDSHTVTLFTPAIAVTKDGESLSKVGDDVDYTFTLSNNSSANTPALTCTATDDVIGPIWGPAVLPPGDTVVNKTYTVQAGTINLITSVISGSAGPLSNGGGVGETNNGAVGATGSITNTVTLSCDLPPGFTNTIADVQDSHTLNLFTPSIAVTKDGESLSKAGDDVDYTFTLSNNSSANTPALTCTATDDVIGPIWGPGVLPPGDTVVNKTHMIPAGTTTSSVTNTVTLSCSLPSQYTNTLADVQDSHTVNLFTPVIAVTKDGESLSKAGDDVDYTFTLSNNSSANAPALTCTATDDVIGPIWGPGVLPPGDTVVNKTHMIPAGTTASSITNTVTLSCALPSGFTNTLADVQDSHTVSLFSPSIGVTKDGDAYSKAGDDIDYTFTLSNNSSANTPPLTCTATDNVLGLLFGPAPLPPGDTVINLTYSVPASTTVATITNTVTLRCSLPSGYTNTVADVSDSHTVTLLRPAFAMTKTCTNEPVPQSGPATWDIVVTNTGNADLIITVQDPDALPGPVVLNLAPGTSNAGNPIKASIAGSYVGQATVFNSASATAVIAPGFGTFTNSIGSVSASDTCAVAGEAKITKLTQGDPNEPPFPNTRTWTFTLQDCGTNGCTQNDPILQTVTSPPSMVTFSADLVPYQLDPNQSYRLCEALIPVGWTNTWMGDANDDLVVETVIPFVPAVNDDPVNVPPGWSGVFDPAYSPPPAIWDNSERCLNFVADAGETELFEIDNRFPGGEPRTIGYWKNWDSCSGGGQITTAIENCGPTPGERLSGGCALLDDVLQPPGIILTSYLTLVDLSGGALTCDPGVADARYLLDKRDLTSRHRKRANDAAYGLAAQLIAAIANDTAGAGVCAAAGQAVLDAKAVLETLKFDGTKAYCGKKGSPACSTANSLAGILDSYNNGILCAP